MDQTYNIVIVGAGISGAVLAERYASIGKKVLVIEKRDHIAGNCYDYYDEHGILVSKYGAHIFHTNFEDVWEYVQKFSKWRFYEHRVKAKIDTGELVPIPVNIETVNKVFGLKIKTEAEMIEWLDKNQVKNDQPKNAEEAALARVGKVLYEKLFKYYTKKQWDRYPAELDASVTNRIPVRTNFDDRYFTDKYQYLPVGGYTKMFARMLSNPNITVKLDQDYFDIKDQLKGIEKLFYTGPIDRFFNFMFSGDQKLEYRSINFVFESYNQEYYQDSSVVNYNAPGKENFTRIVEYKHLTGQKSPITTISKEYTVDADNSHEPFYPVPNPRNQEIYEKYKEEADKLQNIYFVGRLANYKYFNMDQAFKNALDLFIQLEGKPAQMQNSNTILNNIEKGLKASYKALLNVLTPKRKMK